MAAQYPVTSMTAVSVKWFNHVIIKYYLDLLILSSHKRTRSSVSLGKNVVLQTLLVQSILRHDPRKTLSSYKVVGNKSHLCLKC